MTALKMSVAGKRRRRGQGRLPPKGFGTGTQGANEKLIPDPRPLAPATFMPRPRRGVVPLPRRPPRAGGRGLSPRRASGQESKAHRSHYLLSDARKASRTLYALRRKAWRRLILSMPRLSDLAEETPTALNFSVAAALRRNSGARACRGRSRSRRVPPNAKGYDALQVLVVQHQQQ